MNEPIVPEPVSLASPDTLVLVGAGVSVDAGLPSSSDLQTLLRDRLHPLYGRLTDIVFPDGGRVDPERVFRVLAFLHAVETEGRPADMRHVVEPIEMRRLVNKWHPDIEEYLIGEEGTVSGSVTGQVIDQLWAELLELLWLRHGVGDPDLRYLVDLLGAMRGQTIVTLNYDNALQHVSSYGMAYTVDDAPYPHDWSIPTPGYGKDHYVRLICLHGALNWRRNSLTGDIGFATDDDLTNFRSRGVGSWNGDTPGVIFGAGNKLRPDGPYLHLYAEFERVLAAARQVIIIGYSFRDVHVNEALRRWFLGTRSGSTLRIGCLHNELPAVVGEWGTRTDLRIQVIAGRAAHSMRKLVAPISQLAQESA